jgi:hypothetical protein
MHCQSTLVVSSGCRGLVRRMAPGGRADAPFSDDADDQREPIICTPVERCGRRNDGHFSAGDCARQQLTAIAGVIPRVAVAARSELYRDGDVALTPPDIGEVLRAGLGNDLVVGSRRACGNKIVVSMALVSTGDMSQNRSVPTISWTTLRRLAPSIHAGLPIRWLSSSWKA